MLLSRDSMLVLENFYWITDMDSYVISCCFH